MQKCIVHTQWLFQILDTFEGDDICMFCCKTGQECMCASVTHRQQSVVCLGTSSWPASEPGHGLNGRGQRFHRHTLVRADELHKIKTNTCNLDSSNSWSYTYLFLLPGVPRRAWAKVTLSCGVSEALPDCLAKMAGSLRACERNVCYDA